MAHYKTPALVIGMNHNGLGMVRSLSALGIPVYAADSNVSRPSMQTRFGAKLRLRSLSGPELVEDLIRFRSTLDESPVLLLTTESAVRTLSEYRHELLGAYRFLLPDQDLLAELDLKESFQLLAERKGYPVPHSIVVSHPDDIEQAQSFHYPCVIKPSHKNPDFIRYFSKAKKVSGFDELKAYYQAASTHMSCFVVQEWIEGEDSDIYFCMQYLNQKSECTMSFVGRKVRAWPPQVGGTASCTAAPELQELLTQTTADFFHDVGYVGMGSMEYKRDKTSGRFVMIEPTVGRADFQEEVCILNGYNIPLAAYHDALGLPPPAIHPGKPLQVWRDGRTDRWSAKQQGHATRGFPKGSKVRDTYLRLNDPGPWLSDFIQRVTALTKRTRSPRAPITPKTEVHNNA